MLDIVIKVDRLPKSGEDIYGEPQGMSVGGCAYNVADILRHFEVPYTLFAPIGKGIYAEIIDAKLKEAGQESCLRSEEKDNGYCLSLVESNGERTFLTIPGIECSFKKEWFDALDAAAYDCAYVSGYEVEGEGGNAILEFFEAHPQLTIYYGPGPRITYISKEKQKRLQALHPVLHLNEKEALDSTGETDYTRAAWQLSKLYGNTVLITLGDKGVYLQERGQEGLLVPSQPAHVVDTIGAGDAHIGAVIAMRQKGADFKRALEVANRVSALIVGVAGPTLTDEEFRKGDIEG